MVSPAMQSRHNVERFFDDPKAQALAVAAERNNVPEVRRLMRREHVNPDIYFAKVDGLPLVAWPIFTESPEGLKALLENGADPNARHPQKYARHYPDGSVGESRYEHYAAMNYAVRLENPVYLELLLKHGGDPNTPNKGPESLLYHAKLYGTWRNVQLLVEHGANTNVDAVPGRSILALYTTFANFEQAYWLLEHGADPMSKVDHRVTLPPPHSQVVDDIYWYPTKTATGREWQRRCQLWLMAHGIPRPEKMGDVVRKTRQDFHHPDREEDIPLPAASASDAKE